MMQKNVMIYNELKELNSPLADISNRNVFTVPDGYFASLSSDILHSIYGEHEAATLNIPALDLKIPEGYFKGLADSIMHKIKTEEVGPALADEYPGFLAAVRYTNVFKVPDGYFDNLAGEILSKVPATAKVITMKQRPSVFRYAAAACITGILGLSLFSVFNNKPGIEMSKQGYGATAKMDKSDIIKRGNDILKNNSFDKMMEALGEEEIEGYLKNDGGDINAALVASLSDEKTLPNEDDYFIDDQALENFLNEQHIVQSNNN